MSENSNFNAIFGGVVPTTPTTINRKYGLFRSALNQILTTALIPQAIGLEITDESDGVSVSSGVISFTTTGVYMMEVTILFKHISPITSDTGYVWYEKGGVQVASTTRLIKGNPNIDNSTLTLSYMVEIADTSTDTIQFYFTATSIDLSISRLTSASYPSGSSVILNVFQIAN